MQLYVLDRAKNTLATTSSFYSDKHHKELAAGASIFEFAIDKSDSAAQYMNTGNYLVFKDDRGRAWSFTILSCDETQTTKTVAAEDVSIELLNKAMDVWNTDQAYPFSYYFGLITKGTPWTLGVNQLTDLSRKLIYTGRDTGLGRLLSVLKGFDNAECQFNIKVQQNKPVEFVVDVYKSIGTVQDNIQIVYNNELADIKKTESRAQFVTALAGVGGLVENQATTDPGLEKHIDFTDIDYKDDNFVSPKGDKFLRAVTANRTFNPGTTTYIEDFYDYDTQSAQELLNRTLTQLKERSEPQYTYDADVKIIDPTLDIGDTVTIIDHDYNPALYLQARVATLDKSYTDPTQGAITFCNYRVLNSNLSDQLRAMQNIIDQLPTSASIKVINNNIVQMITQNEELKKQVALSFESANGKSRVWFSKSATAQDGDVAFIKNADGATEIWKFVEGTWKLDTGLATFDDVKKAASAAADAGSQAVIAGQQASAAGSQAAVAGLQASTAGSQAISAGSQASYVGSQAAIAGKQASVAGSQASAAGSQAVVAGQQASTAGSQAASAGSQAFSAGSQAAIAGKQASAAGSQAVIAGLQASTAGAAAKSAGDFAASAASQSTIETSAAQSAANSAVDQANLAVSQAGFANDAAYQAKTDAANAQTDSKDAKQIAGAVSQSYKTLTDGSTMTIAELQNGLAVKLTKTDLDGYATQSWSQNQLSITENGITESVQNMTSDMATQTWTQGKLDLTADGFTSQISSVETDLNNLNVGGRNYFLNSERFTITPPGADNWDWAGLKISSDFLQNTDRLKNNNIKISFDLTAKKALAADFSGYMCFRNSPWYGKPFIYPKGTAAKQHYELIYTISDPDYTVTEMFIRFQAKDTSDFPFTLEHAKLEVGTLFTDWSPAPEDMATVVQFTSLEQTLKGVQITANNAATQSQFTLLADQFTSVIGDLDNLIIGGDFEDQRDYLGKPSPYWSGTNAVADNIDKNQDTNKSNTVLQINGLVSGNNDVTSRNLIAINQAEYNMSLSTKWHNPDQLGSIIIYAFEYDANKNLIAHPSIVVDGSPHGWRVITATYKPSSSAVKYMALDVTYNGAKSTLPVWIDDIHLGLATATQSQITQLQNDINLRVKTGDLVSQIDVNAKRILLDGASTYITNTTHIDTGVIKTAMIADAAINNAKIANAAIDNAKIADASIDNAKIADLAVRTAQIADGAITNAKIGNASITTAKIGDAQINSAKIAELAVTTAQIANGAITTAKIGSLAVGTAQIDDAAINSAKIADLAVNTAQIADGAISNAKIGKAAIFSAQIADLAVGTAQIADAAINNAKIANAAIDNAKIANAAINSAKIADLAVGSAQIADGAINSAKIGNAAITSAKIADASILDAKIVSLDGSKIVAHSITADQLDANAIAVGLNTYGSGWQITPASIAWMPSGTTHTSISLSGDMGITYGDLTTGEILGHTYGTPYSMNAGKDWFNGISTELKYNGADFWAVLTEESDSTVRPRLTYSRRRIAELGVFQGWTFDDNTHFATIGPMDPDDNAQMRVVRVQVAGFWCTGFVNSNSDSTYTSGILFSDVGHCFVGRKGRWYDLYDIVNKIGIA